MNDDIVARLRDCTCVPHGEICREAADEIERLRAGGCTRDQNTTQFCAEAVQLQHEVERLREERDGARVEVCLLRTGTTSVTDTVNQSMADYADSRGWHDLFREEH